jgi:hypothetical protein
MIFSCFVQMRTRLTRCQCDNLPDAVPSRQRLFLVKQCQTTCRPWPNCFRYVLELRSKRRDGLAETLSALYNMSIVLVAGVIFFIIGPLITDWRESSVVERACTLVARHRPLKSLKKKDAERLTPCIVQRPFSSRPHPLDRPSRRTACYLVVFSSI